MNDITLFAMLGLDESSFDGHSVENVVSSDGIDMYARLAVTSTQCPYCLSSRTKRHGSFARTVRCSLNANVRQTLHVEVPRLVCKECGRTFSPAMKDVRSGTSVSRQVKRSIAADFRRRESFGQIAERYHVSDTFVMNLFDAASKKVPRGRLTECLCIDEFHFLRTGKLKYPAIIVDCETGKLIDVVESRQARILGPYFSRIPLRERQAVRFFSSDMYDGFRAMKARYFKTAVHVIDMFHIVKQATGAMMMERAKCMKREGEATPLGRFMKAHWKLFQDRRQSLRERLVSFGPDGELRSNVGLMDECFAKYPSMLAVYDAEQAMFGLSAGRNKRASGDELDWVISKLAGSGSAIGAEAARTYVKWGNEIRTTLRLRDEGCAITNSRAEGMNNNIATLVKLSYGCFDFVRFRKRALLMFGMKSDWDPDGFYVE